MELKQNKEDNLENEREPAIWTALEERIFIHLMIGEVHKGNRSSSTFSKKGWKHIEHEFFVRTNKRYNYSQLRNKFNLMRKRYLEFSKLLKEPGFVWDAVINNVTATDATWESYLKVNKNAIRFRRKGHSMFNELGIIFGEPLDMCKDVSDLIQHPVKSEQNEDESTSATPPVLPNDCNECEESGDYSSLSAGQRRRRRSPTPMNPFQGKRETKIAALDEVLKEHPEVEEVPSHKLDSASMPCDFSITKCVKCLESIDGIDTKTYLKVIEMFKDVEWREMFMAMSSKRRLDWLASLKQ